MDLHRAIQGGCSKRRTPRFRALPLLTCGFHGKRFQWMASAIFLFTLGTLLLTGSSSGQEAEMITVTLSDHGKTIQIASGSRFRVQLEQAGASGYTWEIQNLDTSHLEVLETKMQEAPEPGDFTGASVGKTWVMKAKKAGCAELRICHYRPWEGIQSAIQTLILKIDIY
jgi:predicted secreted protein